MSTPPALIGRRTCNRMSGGRCAIRSIVVGLTETGNPASTTVKLLKVLLVAAGCKSYAELRQLRFVYDFLLLLLSNS